jgi:hypothetical protein
MGWRIWDSAAASNWDLGRLLDDGPPHGLHEVILAGGQCAAKWLKKRSMQLKAALLIYTTSRPDTSGQECPKHIGAKTPHAEGCKHPMMAVRCDGIILNVQGR